MSNAGSKIWIWMKLNGIKTLSMPEAENKTHQLLQSFKKMSLVFVFFFSCFIGLFLIYLRSVVLLNDFELVQQAFQQKKTKKNVAKTSTSKGVHTIMNHLTPPPFDSIWNVLFNGMLWIYIMFKNVNSWQMCLVFWRSISVSC